MEKRDVWVDYAKGIGIIFVVYGHIARGLHNSGIWVDDRAFSLIDAAVYSFHMPLFFFLSGIYFFPSIERRGPVHYVASKVDTLVYPYILWSLLQGSIEVGFSRFSNTHTHAADVAALLWAPRAQFWFLYALFFISLAFAALYRLGLMKRGVTPLPLALFVLAYFAGYAGPVQAVASVSGYGVFFCIGAYLASLKNAPPHSFKWVVLPSILAGVAASMIFISVERDFAAVRLLVALTAILVIVYVSGWLAGKNFKWLAVLGRHSMSIFLMHFLAGAGARVVLSKFVHISSLPVHLIVGVVVGLLAPLLVHELLTRIKAESPLLSPPKCLSVEYRLNAMRPYSRTPSELESDP
jgi:fucose 4-O-acetylase-like acetyltransferase